MDFPLYKNFCSVEEINRNFKKLSKLHMKKLRKLTDRSLLSLELNYDDYLRVIKITDYFSQSCRIKCAFNKNKTPLEFYNSNKKKISEFKTYDEIDTFFVENIKECNNFPLPIVVEVYRFFKAENVLDFSAGWGDRLIGAMAYGCRYTGVDPSNCMAKKYKEMIEFFGVEKKDYKVYKKPFEEFKMVKFFEKFDLVFTSPPFFDLEIYEKSPFQSIHKFTTIEKWKTHFLFPALKKSCDYLKENGHLAIYISDYKNVKYVKDMKNYIKKLKKFVYKGTLNWINIGGRQRTRSIYVWKKLNN